MPITIPYTFVANTDIIAAEQNSNNNALVNGLNAIGTTPIDATQHGDQGNWSLGTTQHTANEIEMSTGTVQDALAIAWTTIAATSVFPITVAHGKAFIRKVEAQFRAYDAGTTGWSKWMDFSVDFHSDNPGTNSYWIFPRIVLDDTNIIFDIKQSNNVAAAGNYYSSFSAGAVGQFWFPSITTNTMLNTWDTIEIRYRIRT